VTSPADLERAVVIGRTLLPFREVFLDGESYRRAGATAKAIACYELACVSPDPSEWLPASRRLADIRRAAGHWDEAEAIALHCRTAAQQHGLVLEEALAVNVLAAIRWAQGDVPAAAYWFGQAATSFEPTARGFALMNLGVLAAQENNTRLAVTRFTAAHLALTIAEDFEALANLDLNRANLRVQVGQYGVALHLLAPAMAFARRGNAELYACMLLVYGEALSGLARFEEAEVAIATAAGHFTHARCPTRHVSVLLSMARLAEQSGDVIEAVGRYGRAREAAECFGMEAEARQASERMEALMRGLAGRPTLMHPLS
jgi:tetratricopeptide (TPR) repeat protein